MRWWSRFVWTLALTPVLYALVLAYLSYVNGTDPAELWGEIGPQLVSLYETASLPALALCLILLATDRLLHAIGADLTTIVVSPLVAFALAAFVLPRIPLPAPLDAPMAPALFVAYGLVWALTIREPKRKLWTGEEPAGALA